MSKVYCGGMCEMRGVMFCFFLLDCGGAMIVFHFLGFCVVVCVCVCELFLFYLRGVSFVSIILCLQPGRTKKKDRKEE